MQKRKVNRIDVTFVGLQIVALVKNLRDIEMIGIGVEKIVVGQQWWLARSHVGEDRARYFLTRIGAMANLVAMLTAARLARLLEASSFDVVEPAMIEATQAAVFEPSIAEIRAAVRTVDS